MILFENSEIQTLWKVKYRNILILFKLVYKRISDHFSREHFDASNMCFVHSQAIWKSKNFAHAFYKQDHTIYMIFCLACCKLTFSKNQWHMIWSKYQQENNPTRHIE